MRAAIIDCGTNTFHLLVAEYDITGRHKILLDEKRNVKLGEGYILHNKIGNVPFERGITTFIELSKLGRSYNPDVIKGFGTSALRGAANGKEFVEKVYASTGVNIEVISGEREAQLIFKGVKLALGDMPATALIMDIGGGSTEFILAKGDTIICKFSFELGVSRLLQKLRPADPVSETDVKALIDLFAETLTPLARHLEVNSPEVLIGCSGSFESLASMIHQQIYQKPFDENTKTYNFREQDFQLLYQRLITSDETQRRNMPGLVEARVDTIVHASIFIDFVKKQFNIPGMIFSNYALKEGAFRELMDEI